MCRLALLFVVLAAAGCMGGDEAAIERSELRGLVLQPGDLPSAFIRFDEGAQVRADRPRGARGDPTRFGREDGWKARYRRAGSSQTRGPLVIESRTDLFDGSDGAEQDLTAHEAELVEGLRLVDRDPGVGAESFVATGVQGSGRFTVRHYLVAWRDENVTASVLVNGFEGKLKLGQILELARKQQQRIDQAI